MKKFWFALCLGGLLLAACKADVNEQFIQGEWFNNSQHIQEVVGESFQQTTWVFDRGTFAMSACCFLPAQMSGRYDVIRSEEGLLELELYHIDGDLNSEPVQIRLRIDRDSDTLTIQRGEFTRLIP